MIASLKAQTHKLSRRNQKLEQGKATSEIFDPALTLIHGIVSGMDENGDIWKETAEVISCSPTGSGFYVRREVKPGRLLKLMAPFDPALRCYDEDRELYRVWGLVQNCQKLVNEDYGYHIGVGFIGRNAPESYYADPMQNYRICGMNEDGLWKIREAAREFKPRKDPRFYTSVEHYLALVDGQKASLKGEWATTENISKRGAAVLTSLDATVGDRIKFISEKYDFSGLAVVCNRRDGVGGKSILNLQFVEASFPIEKVKIEASEVKEELVPA